ncbi:pyridine nucleotide transhydrogenase [Alteromonas aestuariivivens]|uniref:Pyridine nucleotide transhydrogenase n=1 Tax=Alteromonas aestuariivivens TaxID=1938339 RepID=A0A3D8M3B6_9ALTE|nr:pyridine nucleotide transhydrogenase [Alteromonas aestuariivivens]RDV24024.1 pyridine nucleotide transhydrogenase [Alteromonas aestuariivivens]
MRKLVFGLLLMTSFGVAHAESGQNQLFNCMDAKTFEMNNQCVADQISSNMRYRDAQDKVAQVASENNGDYAIATMTFDPRKMQIDIVAHRDALQANNTLAAFRNQ